MIHFLLLSQQKRKEKNREKKLKKNRIRAQIAARAAANPLDLGAEELEEDSGSDSDDDTSAAVEDKSGPSEVSKEKEHKASKVVSESKPGTGDKQGKRGKRIEKEAKEERAQRAQALQARIDSEAQQVLLEQQKRQQAAQGGAGDGVAGSAPAKEAAAAAASGTVQRCTTCGGAFTDPVLYRQHFRYAIVFTCSVMCVVSLIPPRSAANTCLFSHNLWCRSEWHRFNLNRKLKDLPPLSEEEFVATEASA